ncbi:MAG: type II toxin-antitoxin system RelE/ParE family toxin [Verrucomicrobia bacterium]|nr:type II toxin-antitoxin system RelE/ParE family toxin [Verrucomicrobiota bacterium]
MRHVDTHREASAEAIAAALYYDSQVPGLGADFLRRYDALVATIRRRPGLFRTIRHGVRKARLTRFPYSIYFEASSDRIHIFAVAHHNRLPYYWLERRTE